MLAVSCGKTAGGNNNNNNNNNNNSGNNSGNNGGGDGNGGSGGCTGICPSVTLTLEPLTTPPAWVKISGNTVTISAAGLAGVMTPASDTDHNNRGFDDIAAPGGPTSFSIFNIQYPSARAVMYFVNRASVSTNSITMPATSATGCSSSETADNALASGGNGTCRVYTAGGDEVEFRNYLGTVFNNTDTANHARGTMQCNIGFGDNDPMIGGLATITDTVTFDQYSQTRCSIAVVNSAGGAAMAEIDDAWVTHAASTTEVELHAIGIDVSGKMIPQFSNETGYNLARFITAHDNAAFKRLLQNNNWGELKFKVKIVTAANF